MAYTSSLHLSKHLLLPKPHRARPSSSRSPSFVRAARVVNGAPHVNGHSKKAPNGKVQINGDGKKGAGVVNGKTHVNGHDRIHLSVTTGGGGQDGTGLRVAYQGAPGAYSEFAAKTALPGCETVPCRAIASPRAA
uniref:Prephenate dehydratase domain-containing protein n=1 Tax=Triticum urartu TaxID=4572 RepID=A0A8R7P1D0_TRIUA